MTTLVLHKNKLFDFLNLKNKLSIFSRINIKELKLLPLSLKNFPLLLSISNRNKNISLISNINLRKANPNYINNIVKLENIYNFNSLANLHYKKLNVLKSSETGHLNLNLIFLFILWTKRNYLKKFKHFFTLELEKKSNKKVLRLVSLTVCVLTALYLYRMGYISREYFLFLLDYIKAIILSIFGNIRNFFGIFFYIQYFIELILDKLKSKVCIKEKLHFLSEKIRKLQCLKKNNSLENQIRNLQKELKRIIDFFKREKILSSLAYQKLERKVKVLFFNLARLKRSFGKTKQNLNSCLDNLSKEGKLIDLLKRKIIRLEGALEKQIVNEIIGHSDDIDIE
uniref:Uncharacterized protein n=1 Tax=Mallomonas splendens TaxID=52552 RepID=A0A3G2QZP6_9STRA|nr:hypothetical protein [Mallomonas splendens]AYO28620.1 hypothetical protein [Mallomonas splendens]